MGQLINAIGIALGIVFFIAIVMSTLSSNVEPTPQYKNYRIEPYVPPSPQPSSQYIAPTPKTPAVKQVNTTYNIGQNITAGSFRWKITGFSKAKVLGNYYGGVLYGVEADGEFLLVGVEIENIGNVPKAVSNDFVKVIDNKNREFSPDSSAAIYLKPSGSAISFYDEMNPGIVKKGTIVFDVPKNLSVANVAIANSYSEVVAGNVNLWR